MDFEKDQKQLMKINILGSNSSVGCSSRIFYYYASGEGVPFNWEMKPGIAKDPPKEELPPLSPPPALVSSGLPKPCFHEIPNPYSTVWSRLRRCVWKRITRKGNNRKRLSLPGCPKNDDQHVKDLDVFETFFLECNSDFETFTSPRHSSCSSSSSSSSSPCPPAMQATGSGSCSAGEAYRRPFNCIPIHFAKTLIPIMKRG